MRYPLMGKIVLAAALLFATAAFAEPQAQDSSSKPVTGAIDAPKTTSSASERATTDAAGLGPSLPGAHPVPVPGKPPPRKHRHHRPHP